MIRSLTTKTCARLALFTIAILMLTACGGRMPDINVNALTNCPQPSAEALARSPQSPAIPPLAQTADMPEETIRLLGEVIAIDQVQLSDVKRKHETLVDHGVRLCGWTR
jgi:hypothetical protein